MKPALTRYRLGDGEHVAISSDDGPWVLWTDVAAALTRYKTAEDQEICVPCDDGAWVQLKDLTAMIDEARPKGWQPIATAPKDGTHVLVYGSTPVGPQYSLPGRLVTWCAYFRSDRWYSVPGGYRTLPTHWMKLPEPQKQTV